jgi:hypothetical protein
MKRLSITLNKLKNKYDEVSFGIIPYVIADDGSVSVLFLQHFGGRAWTLPKGRIEYGETEREQLLEKLWKRVD